MATSPSDRSEDLTAAITASIAAYLATGDSEPQPDPRSNWEIAGQLELLGKAPIHCLADLEATERQNRNYERLL